MWEKVKLGEICEINIGKTPSRNNSSYWDGTNKWISISDLKGHRYIESTKECITNTAIKESGIKPIPPNTLLYSFKLSIGKIAITKDYIYSNEAIASLPILDNERVFLNYLYWAIQTLQLDNVGDKAVMGITLNKAKLKELEIPLPPLPIQEKIAEILDKADELRRKDKDLQAKYDQLAQAIFIDMFGDPVRNEKGWAILRFGSVINVITDYHANGSYKILNENVKLKNSTDYALMVRTTDLENENFTKDCIYINEYEYNFLKKTKVYGGEIIFSKIGSAGKVYQMPNLNRPVSLGMNCFLIRINSDINTTFLYSQLKSKYGEREINKRIFGAVTKTITKDAVREIPLVLPPIALQEEFAEKIEIINQLKAQTNAEKSEELFQSLLQKAFKGELVS